MITLYVLLPVLPVFHRFVRLEIRRISFPGTDIPAVALILNHAIDGGRMPDFVTKFGGSPILGQQVSDLVTGPSVEIQIEDHFHRLCFILIDHKLSFVVQIVS